MKTIKHITLSILLLSLCLCMGCKDLMTVRNEDRLSGDEFWNEGGEAEVESFMLSIYGFFRTATMMDAAFIVNTGDLRAAPVVPYVTDANHYIRLLTSNNLNELISRNGGNSPIGANIIKWRTFYKVVQSTNILLTNIDGVPDLAEEKKQAYKAEAIFMRNLTYFMMARVFGDIPYYTNAQNEGSLPRSNMVDILHLCLTDLQNTLDADPSATSIPWIQPGLKAGIRPNRGAYLMLMMHINMWLVRFDASKASTYYQNTIHLGQELVDNNGGAYYLLDLSQNSDIFRGGTAETFFEIAQNINAGEMFQTSANFSNLFSYKHNGIVTAPQAYYISDFLVRLFDAEEVDLRREAWFDGDIYNIDGTRKELTKFHNFDVSGTSRTSNAGNQIIFRYADGLLLYAEAQAALGTDDGRALQLLNQVRQRAGAVDRTSSGSELQDDIYWERVRELIGEGQYFFDLVRTGKIHDPNYCYHTISRSNFNAGAWTWPIHPDAFLNNTKMTDNLYWK